MKAEPALGEYASAKRIAVKLEITPRTIHEMHHRGLFPSYRLGHKVVRYKVSEVMAALEIRAGGAA